MKKAILLLIAAAMLVSCMGLCSCSKEEDDISDAGVTDSGVQAGETSAVSAREVVEGLTAEYSLTGGYIFSSESTEYGEYLDEDMISSYYGDGAESPDFGSVTEYCVYIDETDALMLNEIGAFKMTPDADRELFKAYLQARIDNKILQAERYPDIDVAALLKAVVADSGDWVYYSVLKNDSEAVAKKLADSLR